MKENKGESNNQAMPSPEVISKKPFNTMGVPISFTTNIGDTVIVPGGNCGWWLNTAEMSKALHDLLIDPEVFELDTV